MPPTKKSGYHHGDLRRTLIDVSVEVIDQHGVDALNLRALATRAGVSSGAPYHHFADRAELLATIAEEGFQRLEAAMIGSRVGAPDAAGERLAAMGQAYVQFAITHPGHFRVMFRGDARPATTPALNTASQQAFGLLHKVIEDCQRAGVAPAGDPQPLVLTAWSLVHGLATLGVDGALARSNMDPDQMATVVTHLVSRMFAALASDAAQQQHGPRTPADLSPRAADS
jgi:AcrR family transcriptional regulator